MEQRPHEHRPPVGGRLRPLTAKQVQSTCDSAVEILSKIGMASFPKHLLDQARQAGAVLRADDRICFPQSMIEDAISRVTTPVHLPNFGGDEGLVIGDNYVHIGTGGAAVQVLDTGGRFLDSQLQDLYNLMRIVNACESIHYGIRPVIARDMANPFELDINTAFACLKATNKPIGVSFDNADHVAPVLKMFDTALGAENSFRQNPFCMGVIVHVVPPLRFAEEGCAVLEACIRGGMIPQICSAGQAGATSPVTLAGALAQGLAESLAGLMLVDLISSGHPCIFALMPFISDLRTGAMSGGSGESAIANAAAAQVLAHLGLPSTVSAGMTDAKTADTQAGYEKGYSVALAAHAGANMINLSVGMLGSIMVASPEMLVIDDDMCRSILRSVEGIEFAEDAFDLDMIDRVVTGEGHYLGEPQTLARMKSEYVYPHTADRQSVIDWIESGSLTSWERAHSRVEEILAGPESTHLPREAEEKIRDVLPIRLERNNFRGRDESLSKSDH